MSIERVERTEGFEGLSDSRGPVGVLKRALLGIASFVRRKPLGALGAFLLLLIVLMAILADLLAPHDPLEFFFGVGRLADPSGEHPLGTDHLGRDLLSRLIHGSRSALRLSLSSVIAGTTIGALVGLISGYYGGKIDLVFQRIVDSWMAIPGLVLALAVVGSLGASTWTIIMAIAFFIWPSVSRVIRSVTLSVKEQQFVDAARAIGAGDFRIIRSHVLPQTIAPFIIMASSVVGAAIVIEAALAFLGLGTPPPNPSWGGMLSNQVVAFVREQPTIVVWPGIFISVAVFGANLLGDSLRDVLDPRLRGT